MSGGHLFLIGFMGAGKSTVARLVAERLGLVAVDLDEMIEQRAGRSVTEIFDRDGEDAFRDLETEALSALSALPPRVVACGGGVVLRPENRALLKRLGTVVHLTVTADVALARIGDVSTRPLLAGPSGTLAATRLLEARERLYRSVADLEVDTVGRSPDAVADAVVETVRGAR